MASEIPVVGEKGGAVPPSSDTVALRTFLEALVDLKVALILQRCELAGQAVDARFAAAEKALELQAAEYGRRLEILNHAHAQAEAERDKYLPRELFEATLASWTIWRDSVSAFYLPREVYETRHAALRAEIDTAEAVRLREETLAREVTEQTRLVMEGKLEEMNALRRQLEGERALYVTRDMLDVRLGGQGVKMEAVIATLEDRQGALQSRLEMIERARANLDGKFWMLGTGLGALVIIVNVLIRFWTPR